MPKWLAETRREKKAQRLKILSEIYMTNPYRSNAYFLPSTINLTKVVIDDIQGMDREAVSSEVESYVEVLTARNKPPLVLCIIICATNASVNCIWYVSRNLRESESAKIISTTHQTDTCIYRPYPLSMTATNCPLGALGTMESSTTGFPSGPMIPLSASVKTCQCWSIQDQI